MKDIITLSTSKEVNNFAYNLWRTDLFRDSHNQGGGYINRLITKFSEVPRFFYTMTSEVERSHFTTWFNVIALRLEYENDAISDLYYLHEITHAATMYFDPTLSWQDWYKKTMQNEMQASLESEAFAYLELPGLRKLSFDHEIWLDRFWTDCGELMLTDALKERLIEERKNATQSPSIDDFIELQIANYAAQNIEWSRIWAKNWRVVEKHMLEFLSLAEHDKDKAVALQIEFLEEHMLNYIIPFEKEANDFYKLYKENGEKFGNKIIEGSDS